MATTYKAIYKRFNGADWDTFYFATRADQVAEITTGGDAVERRFVNGTQKTSIDTYLATFNAANKLLKLDANGRIPATQLTPGADQLEYVARSGGSFTGELKASSATLNMQDNKIQFGYGTPSGSLAKYQLRASGLNLILSHDIGSGYVNSLFIAPTAISIANRRIQEVGTPTNQTDAANKEYVDNLIASGLTWKEPVKAASIGNVTIGSALNTLDGVTLAAGNRVLLKQQTTASENGVYLLDASKIPQKVAADSTIGDTVFVEGGDTNNDTVYHCNATNTWVLVSKTDTYGIITNGGLEKSGTDFGIKNGGVTNDMLAGSIAPTKLAMWSGLDSDPWTMIGAASTNNGIVQKIDDLFSAIKNLRGTTNYNTNNTQTIVGAYKKNRTFRGDTAPGATPEVGEVWVSGDLYFEGVAI